MFVLWDPLTPVPDVTYEYEVVYSVDPECSDDPVSLPDGYTLYYPRTSTHYIEVVGLMSGTCYVFGVRAYTSVTDSPGEFSLIQGNTISNEGYNCLYLSCVTLLALLIIIEMISLNFVLDMQQSNSNTGLVALSVTLSVIILTLIMLLIVQSMGMIYMKKYVITIQT